jgi:hypothetical protein
MERCTTPNGRLLRFVIQHLFGVYWLALHMQEFVRRTSTRCIHIDDNIIQRVLLTWL